MRCLLSKHLVCIASLAAFASGALGQDTGLTQIKERELEQVRAQISRLKRSMDKRAVDRDRITGELQAAEVKISETRLHLKELERQRDFSQKKKVELDARLEVKETELKAETRQLEAQVRAAYTSGQQERMKLLLNQHDPATLGRLMTYYRYLSEFRGDNIEAVNGHIRELSDLSEQMVAEEKRLAGLARAYTAELNVVSAAQEKRQGLLSALQSKINEEGSEIERLAAQEQDLARLITELTSILSDYPITSEEPFIDLKGRLTWPIAGSLLHDFGQPRAAGGLKWNGVVLAAERGREIRAIYHGRVIFADWLAGMGLLVIVDHGGGYMSLYGYNETTLKIAGDWVAPGDVIATVGDSGGQARSALYFEIRQGTKPLNPRSWVSKQPSVN
jgi:septal ring factor EnvC (AmiA/AmiB activator)